MGAVDPDLCAFTHLRPCLSPSTTFVSSVVASRSAGAITGDRDRPPFFSVGGYHWSARGGYRACAGHRQRSIDAHWCVAPSSRAGQISRPNPKII